MMILFTSMDFLASIITSKSLARNKVDDREMFDPNAYFAEQYNRFNMPKEVLTGLISAITRFE